jgi:GYF domain 2
MFKVKGGDNNEYGPVSVDQIRAWIRENRLSGNSLAEKVGEPGWRQLGDFPEFADMAGRTPPPLAGQVGGVPPLSAATNYRQPGDSGAIDGDAVRAPAICLIIYAAISLLNAIGSMVFSAKNITEMLTSSGMNIPPEVRDMLGRFSTMSSAMIWAQTAFNFALAAAMLFGAIRMLQLGSRNWAIAAGCIAVFPCGGGCCCLIGIPLGIWALVVLARPEVRDAFPKS